LNLFDDLRKEQGLGYLFITHDFAVVRFLADRVAVMEKGRLVELGSTHQVMDAPQHAYTQRLLAAVPRL
jgi:peptide/nickel transport system ATP-binding protein